MRKAGKQFLLQKEQYEHGIVAMQHDSHKQQGGCWVHDHVLIISTR
jgi:hypothetical protein